MRGPHLTWLLRLYPRAWRRRYADEFSDLLAAERPTPRLVLDLTLGALDAHLCPQVEGRRQKAEDRGQKVLSLGLWPSRQSFCPLPSALCLRSIIAVALLVLAILVGGLRHSGEVAQIGVALADRLGPVATASSPLTYQDYSRPALRHE